MSNTFGRAFRWTTFGESHGPLVGVVIDGCPAGIAVTPQEIAQDVAERAPGNSPFTSQRKEPDQVEIVSGMFEGKTTGAPITLLIKNQDIDSSPYEENKHIYRPGHAQITYLHKYGMYDHRGGGRASARETVARVAASTFARKLLAPLNIYVCSYISQIGSIHAQVEDNPDLEKLARDTKQSPVRCPDPNASEKMQTLLHKLIEEKDSVGACVSCLALVPSGLGEPIYYKLPALLGFAMLSIPATKGFEMGNGFDCVSMQGSKYIGGCHLSNKGPISDHIHTGNTLGGIATGGMISFRVAFKPTSSIGKEIKSLSVNSTEATYHTHRGRHDPCVGIRATSVVTAMTYLSLADLYLLNLLSQFPSF